MKEFYVVMDQGLVNGWKWLVLRRLLGGLPSLDTLDEAKDYAQERCRVTFRAHVVFGAVGYARIPRPRVVWRGVKEQTRARLRAVKNNRNRRR